MSGLTEMNRIECRIAVGQNVEKIAFRDQRRLIRLRQSALNHSVPVIQGDQWQLEHHDLPILSPEFTQKSLQIDFKLRDRRRSKNIIPTNLDDNPIVMNSLGLHFASRLIPLSLRRGKDPELPRCVVPQEAMATFPLHPLPCQH